ncbi:ABC transporter substrate-binding protein [Sporomusa acidovorans]|uniref:ABC transporter substrate binding protein n=1 Tax=Sporomusa acidovorans (strain ATCC 49682 / DSM 3132 / Mol) TaxID=1123286 RepID=A0ABZ3J408_SPOA4|nr:ABC transporter substrate-binding protein [Sporomusa acidovorans]OZC15507.1 ABC transporter substrate binding protein [Sporomusa acidovorans DSM 3132]SDE16560.1 putative ABC transport system substrate-binding protein [Sporomusa acidovorans]
MHQIGILQLTQNLDDAVRGFKTGLTETGLSVQFHYRNADGALQDLPQLAENLAKQNVELIFACSTPAAQAAVQLAENIPVVFTPVFDPVSVGLAQTMAKPGGKATGVAGMVPAAAKTAFIHELLPSAKTVGILYHNTDANAVLEVHNVKAAAGSTFTLVDLPINKAEDLSTLSDRLTPSLDVLFLPIGRVVEENFASVAYYAETVNLPIITSHAPNVPLGALGALVANHYALGHACAAKARQILAGSLPGDIPVGIVDNPEIQLNAFVAANLGIELPPALLTKAAEVFE